MTGPPETAFETRLRLAVYGRLDRTGKAPTATELSTSLGVAEADVRRGLERLEDLHVLVLDPVSREIWMAGPFSGVPTSFRVIGDHRAWWANCAWDALGIPAMLQIPARVEARCGDCGEPLALAADPAAGVHDAGLVHLAVPAAQWYDDIGFT